MLQSSRDVKVKNQNDGNLANLESCHCTANCCEDTDSIRQKGGSLDTENEKKAAWIKDTVSTPVCYVYKISPDWTWIDYLGQIRSRISSYRMKYFIAPGLYAIGNPTPESDILVSANYKLSFDILRRELKGLNAWILVLDTNGINVWCAAGKGTFSTDELSNRINASGLHQIVNHKRIIVPQLGAPGVNAAEIKRRTGFRVYFGPVYAKDIRTYLEANYKATKQMRRKQFTFSDRLVLTPMEINPALKIFLLYAIIILVIFGIQPSSILFRDAWNGGEPFLILGISTGIAGAFITPAFLPFIPSRAFAFKGWIVGMLMVISLLQFTNVLYISNTLLLIFTYLFFPLGTSYIALQFTGSTSFTGISGVKKELKISIPFYLIGIFISFILLIIYKLKQFEVI